MPRRRGCVRSVTWRFAARLRRLTGAVTLETATLYVLGLPAMLGGLWLGFRLYGRLDDAAFRRVILVLLLAAGLALIAAHGWPDVRARVA